MEPDEEKKAGLFADLLEYREAFALLKDFGIGFFISFDRFWHGDDIVPYYKVVISKANPVKGDRVLWTATQSDDSFLKAARLCVRAAELESAAYHEKLRATVEAGPTGPMNVAAGWPKELSEGPDAPDPDNDPFS